MYRISSIKRLSIYFLSRGAHPAFTKDWHLLETGVYSQLHCKCEYSNKHSEHASEHAVTVLKDDEIVGHLHVPTQVQFRVVFFCIVFAILHPTSFFIYIFGHTTCKSFVDIHVHQTVLQLPPLTSIQLPPWRCYSVCFSLCHHSRRDYCHVDIVPRPRHLL